MRDPSGPLSRNAKPPLRARAIALKRRIEVHPDLTAANRRFGVALLDRLWARAPNPRPAHRLSLAVIGERLGVSERTARRHIGALEAAGVLEAISNRSGGRGKVPTWALCDPLELSTRGTERGTERVSKGGQSRAVAAMATRGFVVKRGTKCPPPLEGVFTDTLLDQTATASIDLGALDPLEWTPPALVPDRVAELRLALAGPGGDR